MVLATLPGTASLILAYYFCLGSEQKLQTTESFRLEATKAP
jgi:hypothetical protein